MNRPLRTRAGSAVLLAAAVTAGCHSATAPPAGSHSEGGPASAAGVTPPWQQPSSTPSAAIGSIIYVHDPGHVTGPVPSGCHVHGQLPDPRCTPGGADPAITGANIHATICVPGWTARVRPPVSETDALKRKMYAAYGIPAGTASELDHLIPLELGGNNATANLWPEPGAQPNRKDSVENALRRAVCAGRMSLHDAQVAIATDWVAAARAPRGITGQAATAPAAQPPIPVTQPARPAAPPPPVPQHTAPAVQPPAPAACAPRARSGNCYEPGEFCPAADHGVTGIAGNGKVITCQLSGAYWRWG